LLRGPQAKWAPGSSRNGEILAANQAAGTFLDLKPHFNNAVQGQNLTLPTELSETGARR